jgi:hypothetical protein
MSYLYVLLHITYYDVTNVELYICYALKISQQLITTQAGSSIDKSVHVYVSSTQQGISEQTHTAPASPLHRQHSPVVSSSPDQRTY